MEKKRMHFEKNKQNKSLLDQFEIGNELFEGLQECNLDHTKEYQKMNQYNKTKKQEK